MVLQQRLATFHLALALASLILFLALLPALGITGAQPAFALLALTGITPFFQRRTTPDERDRLIQHKSLQLSFGILFTLTVAALWTAYYHYAPIGTLPITYLPLAAWLIWATFLTCQSLTLLILYRKY